MTNNSHGYFWSEIVNHGAQHYALILPRCDALFLLRDAMRKSGLCWRRVSVRLSRWCIVSTRLKISSDFFRPGSLHSSLLISALVPNSSENPFSGAQKCDFRLKSPLSRKRYKIGPRLLWNVNRKSRRRIDPFRFWWPWVTPDPGFKVTVYLQVEYLKNGAM